MKIFDQEIQDGIADLLKSTASITYASVVEPYTVAQKDAKYFKSIASFDDEDLYYVQSILVSSSWNKNDDIFDRVEVWQARHTPEHKPTNLEHDESTIIGHIVSNWPITEDGILIDENTPIENLPEKYHILTGSVIYKGFSTPDLRDRALKLIGEIENGTKYVSMECFFKGFDYGILDKSNGTYNILNRNDNTAYLTKYLRAYGGVGEHENFKIGRVLRNITFTGKGFVDRPANEDSIIFSKKLLMPVTASIISETNTDILEEKNQEFDNSGVLNVQSNIQSETLTMSSVQTEIENKEVAPAVVETEVVASELETKIQELTSANEKLQNELSTLAEIKDTEIKAIKEEAAKKMEEKEAEMKKAKSELELALNTIAEYVTKEEAAMKKEKKMNRVASLVQAGVDTETAEATVDKFESLDDDAFAAMTSLFAAKKAPKEAMKDEEEAMMMKKRMASENSVVEADPSVLETAEVEANVNLGVGSDDAESALESTRAALIEFVSSKLGKKNHK